MNTSKSLDAYHLHSCHSRQAWVKGMTQPFPCDCGLSAAIVEAVEGLLGEDDMELNTDNPVKNARPFYRNKFRAQLRRAIKEWQ